MPILAEAEHYQVSSKGLVVSLNGEGRMDSAKLGDGKTVRPLQAYTVLADCERVGEVEVQDPGDGSVLFVQTLAHKTSGGECTLRELFFPGKQSVRWEVEISGHGDPWSTAVESHLNWPVAAGTEAANERARYWLAYGGERNAKIPAHYLSADLAGEALRWSDPLKLMPFQKMELPYGGGSEWVGFSLPLVTVVDEQADLGLTLALSPADRPAAMVFRSSSNGEMSFARTNLRISKRKVVRLAMDLIVHEGDWRPALGWMVERYPEYFDAPNPKATLMAGCGAFCSSYAGELDAAKMKAMGCRINWGFGFTFPYVGMHLPPVPEGQSWMSFEGRQQSSRTLNELARKWQTAGVETLAYFNTTEWGYKSLDGKRIPTADTASDDVPDSWGGDAWKDATTFLLEKLPGAVLFGNDNKPVFSGLGDDPTNNVVVDPGEPVLAEFWADQVKRLIEEVPASAGICIDRMDWLDRYNPRRDDGMSWVDGKAARSLRSSWLQITDRLGPLLHDAGKVMFVNPHIKRLDLMRQVDGIFDEFGYLPFNNNSTAFLGLRKPVMAWTPGDDYLRADPDGFFQRYLYLGIFPMAPFPENAKPVPWLHAIQPGAFAEKQYRDYAPLLDCNQGKRWVLEAHAVKVKDELAKANVFETPRGYIIPVVFGGDAAQVTVTLRRLRGISNKPTCEVLHPGSEAWRAVTATTTDAAVAMEVPLVRGCAMVRVNAAR